jgi:hypothetical protein
MAAAMQALRLCNRAMANLSRLISPIAKSVPAEDCAAINPTSAFGAPDASQSKLAIHSVPSMALGWRITQVSPRRHEAESEVC